VHERKCSAKNTAGHACCSCHDDLTYVNSSDVICHISQVKVAEHILTGHKVAIKILNRRKISAMDMEEKGAQQNLNLKPC
jgi:hypothetical protein